MTTLRPVRSLAAAAAILSLVVSATSLPAQGLGGLIKKKAASAAGQAAAKQAPATPPAFDDVTLELTDEVLAQVIAGKKAGNEFKRGPNGPAAVRRRLETAEERRNDFFERNAKALEAWDQKRQAIEACRDSALWAIKERKEAEFQRAIMAQNPALIRQLQAINQQVLAAQQRGDTAEVARLARQIQALREPTAADSTEVTKICGDPNAPPAVVAQGQALQNERDALSQQLREAEKEVGTLERHASKLNDKQLAIACERILDYLNKLKAKAATGGFSEEELAALEQHIKDLEDLCD